MPRKTKHLRHRKGSHRISTHKRRRMKGGQDRNEPFLDDLNPPTESRSQRTPTFQSNQEEPDVFMRDNCNNYLQIKFASEKDLNNFIDDYLDHYAKASNKKIISRGTRGIITTFNTKTEPDFEWLEKILRDYPNSWVGNNWEDLDRSVAGVWIGRSNGSSRNGCLGEESARVIQQMQWQDLSAEDRATLFGWRQRQGQEPIQEPIQEPVPEEIQGSEELAVELPEEVEVEGNE
jgi:hypothetical protein